MVGQVTGPRVRTGLPAYRHDHDDADPPSLYEDYVSTRLRSPAQPLRAMPHTLTEITGPMLGEGRVGEFDNDLTRQHDGEPVGQRIVVAGRVLDGDGRPVPNTLLEVWQANAAGRYRHTRDRWPAPLDPNFTGVGRALTGDDGAYRFVTVQPGAYPWRNHDNAWRPAHIHFSLLGRAFSQRLITQMYFPQDPLFFQDPILASVPQAARQRLIARYDHAATMPEWALGYRFDLVLRGREGTPFEDPDTGDGQDEA